jgi:hypothetical protein
MAYDMRLKKENHIFGQIINNTFSSNRLADGNPATETTSTAYTTLLTLKETLVAQDAVNEDGSIVVFAPHAFIKLLKQENIYDNIESGYRVRVQGYVGMIDGMQLVSTNNLPQVDDNSDDTAEHTYLLAFEVGAPCFVDQMTKFKIKEETKGFRHNLLMESVYQSDVLFDVNKKKIVTKEITNMTFATQVRPVGG